LSRPAGLAAKFYPVRDRPIRLLLIGVLIALSNGGSPDTVGFGAPGAIGRVRKVGFDVR
jgi:hypothetical protein